MERATNKLTVRDFVFLDKPYGIRPRMRVGNKIVRARWRTILKDLAQKSGSRELQELADKMEEWQAKLAIVRFSTYIEKRVKSA